MAALVAYLHHHQQHQQATVVDLGSGTGIVGLGMSKLFGYSHVVLTDLPLAVDLLKETVSSYR